MSKEDYQDIPRYVVKEALDCYYIAQKQDTALNRRNFVRAAFAAIDGIIFYIKQDCLNRYKEAPYLYSPEELVQIFRKRSLDDSFHFAVIMVTKKSMPEFKLDRESQNWRNFVTAKDIRNRITHPKTIKELGISDQDLRVVKAAFDWVNETAIEALHKSLTLREEQFDRLRSEHEGKIICELEEKGKLTKEAAMWKEMYFQNLVKSLDKAD
jgi:hypothetical protein